MTSKRLRDVAGGGVSSRIALLLYGYGQNLESSSTTYSVRTSCSSMLNFGLASVASLVPFRHEMSFFFSLSSSLVLSCATSSGLIVVVGVVMVVVASGLAMVAPRSVVLPELVVVLVVAAVASRSVILPQHATLTVADTRCGSPPGSGSPGGVDHCLGAPTGAA